MSNLEKVVAVGKELQKSQQVMNDFKDKKINQDKMEMQLGSILSKVKRCLF